MLVIWEASWEASLERMEQATTGRDTPQALPRAIFDGTKTYGTFYSEESATKSKRDGVTLSSQRRGK
jgi:hypothetical protein